jgi:hypothetical protein
MTGFSKNTAEDCWIQAANLHLPQNEQMCFEPARSSHWTSQRHELITCKSYNDYMTSQESQPVPLPAGQESSSLSNPRIKLSPHLRVDTTSVSSNGNAHAVSQFLLPVPSPNAGVRHQSLDAELNFLSSRTENFPSPWRLKWDETSNCCKRFVVQVQTYEGHIRLRIQCM